MVPSDSQSTVTPRRPTSAASAREKLAAPAFAAARGRIQGPPRHRRWRDLLCGALAFVASTKEPTLALFAAILTVAFCDLLPENWSI